MSLPYQTSPTDDCYDASFILMIDWFNRWLEEPITAREMGLLGEAVDYLATNKVRRYDPSKMLPQPSDQKDRP